MAKPIIERLMDNCIPEPNSGCWLWTARLDRNGYGRIGIWMPDRGHNVPRSAYREMFKALRGPIPEGLELDHLCRVRSCVNPDHLEPVTHKENVRRGECKAQHARQAAAKAKRKRQKCGKGHPYIEGSYYWYAGKGHSPFRVCRECRRIYDELFRAKHKASIVASKFSLAR